MRLPQHPADGLIIMDFGGNRHRYHAELNQWISIGSTADTQAVNYKQDGLITPQMADLLDSISEQAFTDFKINDNEEVYHYLLSGKNRLFTFNVESNDVRIELYRNALTNILYNSACQGSKGDTGTTGVDGEDGLAGPAEKTYTPTVDEFVLSIEVPGVETPLDTAVSLRLSNTITNDFLEIWLDLNGEWAIQSGNTISIDVKNSDVRLEDGVFYAELKAETLWGDGWGAKVRQIGPDGRIGVEGESFITITGSALYALKATESIVGLRKSQDGNLFWVRQTLEELPVAKLKPYGGSIRGDACSIYSTFSLASEIAETDKLLSVEPVLDSNKGLWRWEFTVVPIPDQGGLDLPIWVPDPSCQGSVEFDWWSQFDGTTNQVAASFNLAPTTQGKNCQEDFFFCPSVGDADRCGGTIASGGQWNWPPPAPPAGKATNPYAYGGDPPRWLPL